MKYQKEIVEIRKSNGQRYLVYDCDSCLKSHIVRVDASTMARINKVNKMADTLLLWCGKGELKEPESEDGLTIRIVPKCKLEKKELREIQGTMKDLEMSMLYGVFLDVESSDLIKIAEEKLKSLDKDMGSIERQKEKIEYNIRRLKEVAKP